MSSSEGFAPHSSVHSFIHYLLERSWSVEGLVCARPRLGTGRTGRVRSSGYRVCVGSGGQQEEAFSRQREGQALRPPGPQKRGLSRGKTEPCTRRRVSGHLLRGWRVRPVPSQPSRSWSAWLPDAGLVLGRNLLSVLSTTC